MSVTHSVIFSGSVGRFQSRLSRGFLPKSLLLFLIQFVVTFTLESADSTRHGVKTPLPIGYNPTALVRSDAS